MGLIVFCISICCNSLTKDNESKDEYTKILRLIDDYDKISLIKYRDTLNSRQLEIQDEFLMWLDFEICLLDQIDCDIPLLSTTNVYFNLSKAKFYFTHLELDSALHYLSLIDTKDSYVKSKAFSLEWELNKRLDMPLGDLFAKIERAFKDSKDPREYLTYLYLSSSYQMNISNYKNALSFSLMGIKYLEQTNSKALNYLMIDFLFQLSSINIYDIQFDKALEYCLQLDSFINRNGGAKDLIRLNGLSKAICYYSLGEIDECRKAIEKSEGTLLRDKYLEAYYFYTKGKLLGLLNEPKLAVQDFEKAVQVLPDSCSNYKRLIKNYLAEFYFYQGETNRSLEIIDEVIVHKCDSKKIYSLEFLFYRMKAIILNRLCEQGENLEYCHQALEYFNIQDSLSINFLNKDVIHNSHDIFHITQEKLKACYNLNINNRKINDIVRLLGVTKYRSLKNHRLYIENMEDHVEINKLKKQQEKLLDRVAVLGLNESTISNKIINELYKITLNLIEFSASNSYHNELTNETSNLTEIQIWLKNNNAQFIEYSKSPSGFWLLYLNSEKVIFHKIPISEKQSDAIKYISSVMPSNAENFISDSMLSELFNVLLKNVLDPNIPNLIVSPDGLLNEFPFELLKHQKYLVEKYNIGYSYGINELLDFDNSVSVVNTSNLFSFSDNQTFSSFDEKVYPELSGSYKEVLKCAEILGDSSQLFTGLNCTTTAFFENLDSGILHLATHAFSDNTSRFNNFFVFRDQDSVKNVMGIDVSNLRMNTQHVVLSSCQSGTGALHFGEGVFSLSRYFIEAGVESTISSRWVLQDESASQVLVPYYKYLKRGHTNLFSISQAKRDLIAKGDISPSIWANLVLEGNPLQSFKF